MGMRLRPIQQHRARRVLRRWTSGLIAAALLAGGVIAMQAGLPVERAEAAELDAPQLYKMQGFYDRIDDDVDELRADLVLKVPTGFVNPETGALQSVDGKQLRIGYDYSPSSVRNMNYRNTLVGAAGATAWANNRDEYFTIHSVIHSGKNDFLVISIEGDMDIPNRVDANNSVGGNKTPMNWYFSYSATGGTGWISSALTVESIPYYAYYGGMTASVKTGPQIKLQWDGIYSLWSGDQANWGQVLDFGLNGHAPGVFPTNSFAVDMVNHAMGTATRGPAGSVSDSYWYAWVHEDNTIVDTITPSPIHVTGYPPSKSRNTATNRVSKNMVQGTAPTLAWTLDQAAQGLTDRVSPQGAIDFNGAGGNGYYRLLVWPESRNPETVTVDNGSPVISYTAADLFDASGSLTQLGIDQSWIPASAYYGYHIDLPEAPEITVPAHGSHTNANTAVELSGTGTPGKTITLKLAQGRTITNTNDPSLTTIVDGDHEGVHAGDVVVQPDGTWNYTYRPSAPLTDGEYTVVALQTDQTPGNYHLTSPPSNPNDPADPTSWGVTFTMDTVAPAAPTMLCLASPTEDTTPTISGGNAEANATVHVSEAEERMGEGIVTGANWSYTVDPALKNGTYSFTATQVDRAGNESPRSAPACELRVAVPVDALGQKVVAEIANPVPELPSADAANWEVTLSDGTETVTMSPDEPRKLKRDTTYTIGERLRTEPAPETIASQYTQLGGLACVDAKGEDLPTGVLNPEAQTLNIASDLEIAEPISCSITNQSAHVSLLTQRLGGQTSQPAEGWALSGSSAGAADISLGTDTPQSLASPGSYQLQATAPTGLSVVGVQALDLARPECAFDAGEAAGVPSECWVDVAKNASGEAAIPQGKHSVFRIVAAAPADIPPLPLTGGLGTWVFTAGSAAALAFAAATMLRRRILANRIATSRLESGQ